MEVKNIVLHFPWGAGGNFLRNCLLLDLRYEFDWVDRTTEQRYQHLVNFYQQCFTQENWLAREWSGSRGWLYQKYYKKDNTFDWNTKQPVIFVSHGEEPLMSSLSGNQSLEHVFLFPSDSQFIAEIYVSKSPKIDSHLKGSVPERVSNTIDHIHRFCRTQEIFISKCKNPKVYDANRLFDDNGHQLIANIALALSLQIPSVQLLHQLWNDQNKKLHSTLFPK
jgi:hypothetical protein